MFEFLKKLTRKNVYGTAFFAVIVLVLLYSLFEEHRSFFMTLLINPVWPIALGFLEFVLQDNEKEIASDNQRKLDGLSGVIRKSIDKATEDEMMLVEAVIDAVGVTDLMSISANKVKQEKLRKKLEGIGADQTKVEDLTP